TGARAALPIWLKFMQKSIAETPIKNFQTPEGVVFAKIDKLTGMPATNATERVLFEVFKEGTAPTASANLTGDDNVPVSERFFEMDKNSASSEERLPALEQFPEEEID
ncbi:MAG TPA: hypothetical protein DCL42_08940, partial [Deltaproteobacteria bacterium]|nr:hypothetical protein [Deltaproteobacteria bacterium]